MTTCAHYNEKNKNTQKSIKYIHCSVAKHMNKLFKKYFNNKTTIFKNITFYTPSNDKLS